MNLVAERIITPAWDGDARAMLARMNEARDMLRSRSSLTAPPIEYHIAELQRAALQPERDQAEARRAGAALHEHARPKYTRPRHNQPGRADTPCPSAKFYDVRSCGHQPVRYAHCRLVTCPDCERERAGKERAAWAPAIKKFNNPVAITLTWANQADPKACRETGVKALRRLGDLRLGSTGRRNIALKAFAFIDSLADGALQGRTRLQWKREVVRWLHYIERKEAKYRGMFGARLKFRQLLRGIINLESTFNDDAQTWHFHFHGVLDLARFMPWPALVACWTLALRQTEYAGAHISAVHGDPCGEAFKYALKPSDAATLTTDQAQALIDAMYCSRRVFVFDGFTRNRKRGIRRIEPEREPCPCCGSLDCKSAHAGTTTIPEGMTAGAFKTRDSETACTSTGATFTVTEYTDPKFGRMWRKADDPTLSRTIPNVNTSGCKHDAGPPRTTTGPPEWDFADSEWPQTEVTAW